MRYFLTGAGRVIYSAVIFLLSAAASRYFTVDGYAVFKEFYMYLLIGISLSAFSAVNTLLYFRERSFKTSLLIGGIALFLSTAVYGALFIFNRRESVLANMAVFPSTLSYMMLEAELISRGKQRTALLLNITEALSFALPLFAVMLFRQDASAYMKYLAALSLIKLPVYSAFIYLSSERGRIYGAAEVSKYSAPLFMNGFFGAVSKQSDKYFVSMLFSGRVFAEYSSGAFEIPLVSRFVNGYFHSSADEIRKRIESNDFEGLKNFFSRTTGYIFLALGFFSVLFIANSQKIIEILYTSRYAGAYVYFSIYMTVFPLRLIPFGFIMSMYGRTKELFALSVADAAVTVVLTLILLRIFGPVGGAAAYAAATVVQIGLMLLILRPIFPAGKFLARYIFMLAFFAAEMCIEGKAGPLAANILPAVYALCAIFIARRDVR